MSKSNDEIYDLIIDLRGTFDTFTATCALKHTTIDEKVHLLDKTVNGNGNPGLKADVAKKADADALALLTTRYNTFEMRALAVVGMCSLFGPLLVEVLKKKLGF